MAREKLVLVERFEELRAGMIVVVKGCRVCQRDEREMLLRINPTNTGWSTTSVGCIGRNGLPSVVGRDTVATRRLFRVVDGMESSQTMTRTREKERRR